MTTDLSDERQRLLNKARKAFFSGFQSGTASAASIQVELEGVGRPQLREKYGAAFQRNIERLTGPELQHLIQMIPWIEAAAETAVSIARPDLDATQPNLGFPPPNPHEI